MAFSEHYRISAIGRIGVANPSERFQYSICAAGAGLESIWSLAEHARFADIADDVYNFHSRAETPISSEALLEVVKIARIGTDGKYIGDAKVYDRVVAGSIFHNSKVAPQNALAVSLNTARSGPTGRGRFYLPLPIVNLAPSDGFRMSAEDAATVNGSVEELIEAINNIPGADPGDFQVVVASSKGYNTPVSSVRTGRVIDTIRRRRRSLREEYSPNLDTD